MGTVAGPDHSNWNKPERARAGTEFDESVKRADGQSGAGHDYATSESRDTAVDRLLAAYAAALDSMAAKPAILFLPHDSVPRPKPGLYVAIPHANRLALMLAEMHIAVRLDALARRAQRFSALDPGGRSPLDLDRLNNFRNSLSPPRARTLALWIVVLALAVSFPVAFITDYLRIVAPQAIVCSSRFSLRDAIFRFAGKVIPRSTPGCGIHHAGPSLVVTLERTAHLNLSAGGVIDTVLTVRAGGVVVLLLLMVVLILSLCVVFLPFRSGFRLKRLAFSAPYRMTADRWSLLRSLIGADGLYAFERDVFTSVGLRYPAELPLDLLVSAGALVLPLTIAAEMLITATLPRLDLATKSDLAIVAVGVIAMVFLRLQWLARVWRSRLGTEVVEFRDRWLPDGSAVLISKGAYGATLLATAYAMWGIAIAEIPGAPIANIIPRLLVSVPLLAWPLSMFWWYRLRRELRSGGHCLGLRTARAPLLSLIPWLAGAVLIVLVSSFVAENTTGLVGAINDVTILVVLIGFPISLYRMGQDLEKCRCRIAGKKIRRARLAGLRAVLMLSVPFVAMPYFQHSCNRIWQKIAQDDQPESIDLSATYRYSQDDGQRNVIQVATAPEGIPSAHWLMAITALILCWPAGIPAIIYASLATFSVRKGELAAARKLSSRVRIFFWAGLTVFAVVILFAVLNDSH